MRKSTPGHNKGFVLPPAANYKFIHIEFSSYGTVTIFFRKPNNLHLKPAPDFINLVREISILRVTK